MNSITYNPIGVIHTPFTESKGTPIQPTAGIGIKGFVDIWILDRIALMVERTKLESLLWEKWH